MSNAVHIDGLMQKKIRNSIVLAVWGLSLFCIMLSICNGVYTAPNYAIGSLDYDTWHQDLTDSIANFSLNSKNNIQQKFPLYTTLQLKRT